MMKKMEKSSTASESDEVFSCNLLKVLKVLAAQAKEVIENIEYFFSSPLDNHDKLADLYLTKGLSASEIARKCGHSKTFVLELLKKYGIDRRSQYVTGEKGAVPPFGMKKTQRGRGIEPLEQKIITKILNLRAKELSLREIAAQLEGEGIFARNNTMWHLEKIRRILAKEASGEISFLKVMS